jgi:hypothetical protein
MAALVCFDGLVPLGPDFALKGLSTLKQLSTSEFEQNKTFKAVSSLIPGGSAHGQLGFVTQSFESVRGWMERFVTERNLTPERVVNHLETFVEISKDKLDYLGAFLDMSCKYYEHTGIQTLARRLIERAVAEI